MYRLYYFFNLIMLVVGAGVLNTAPPFDAYQTIIRRTANRGDKVQIFQSVWGAIRADFPDDSEKTRDLYMQITNFINNEQKCNEGSGRAACELQQEVRRHLRKLASQRLANLLNADQNIEAYSMFLTSSLEPALLEDILEMVVDDVYHHKPTEQLAQQLYKIYAENDEGSFKTMVQAELALYWKHQRIQDINDDYDFIAAYYFNKIRTNHLFANIGETLTRRIRNAFNSLPEALQHLYATQGFCLMNKAHEEYIYTTVTDEFNYGTNGRYVFTWHEKNYTDQSAIIRAFVSESHHSEQSQQQHQQQLQQQQQQQLEQQQQSTKSQKLSLNFSLRGELYKWYFYVDKAENYLLSAWRTGSPTTTSSWTIKYIDNYLVFMQSGMTLCSGQQRDQERRFINTFNGQLETQSDDCLWLATKCKY